MTLTFFAGTAAGANTFVFTAIPDQDETQLQKRFGKVAEYLGKQLAVDVRFVPVKSYAAAFQAIVLIAYVPLYGWLASRLPRQKLLTVVIIFLLY